MTFGSSLRLRLLLLVLVVPAWLSGCSGQKCERDADCVIFCQCTNGADLILGGYGCSAGYCGAGYTRDLDCADPCSRAVPGTDITPAVYDDDDSGDDDSGAR